MKDPLHLVSCPHCGTPIDPSKSGGICPACALRGVLDAPATVARGARLGRYELVERLGAGGMGAVWLAEDPGLERLVALKTLAVAPAQEGSLKERLLREARAVARLDHPHVVKVFETGEDDGVVYLAMEFVEGGDLRDRLRKGPLAPRAAVDLLAKVASAVAHAHANGLLHRDLKPGNILLSQGDEPKVADFGLAGPLSGRGDLTAAGQVIGTPAYLAPETTRGEPADVRTDVYGLGALFYELLTGRSPFTGSTTAEILTQVTGREPVAPRVLMPGLPRDLETICQKCMEKDPARRYPSAAAVEADLRAFAEGRPIAARPLSTLGRTLRWGRREPRVAAGLIGTAGGLLGIALLGLGSAWLLDRERARAEEGEAEARQSLRTSLIAQAGALRLLDRPGRREDSLAALAASGAIEQDVGARDEAVAALAQADRTVTGHWVLGHDPQDRIARIGFDEAGASYAVEWRDRPGLELRRTGSGDLVCTMPLPLLTVGEIRFSPDGRFLAARTIEGRLRVWRTGEGAEAWRLEDRLYYDNYDSDRFGGDLRFSPDSRILGIALEGGGYSLHDVETGTELRRWVDPRQPRQAKFSPGGDRIVVGDFQTFEKRNELVILETATMRPVLQQDWLRSVTAFAWSPDGRRLAVSHSMRVEILDADDGESLLRIEVPDGPVAQMTWSPEGDYLLGRLFWSYRAWDPHFGIKLMEWENHYTQGGIFYGVDASGTHFAGVDEDHRGVTWDWSRSPVHRTLRPGPSVYQMQVLEAPSILRFSRDSRFLGVTGMDRVYILDVATGKPVWDREILEMANTWQTVDFGPDARTVYWTQGRVGFKRLRFTDAADGTWQLEEETMLHPWIWGLLKDVSPDGRLAILSDTEEDEFRVIDLEDGSVRTRWTQPVAADAAFSPDGRRVLSIGWPRDPKDPTEVLEMHSIEGDPLDLPISATYGGPLAWAAKADRVLAVTGARAVTLWSPEGTWPQAELPPGYARAEGNFALSDDGLWVAAWNGRQTALLDGRTGELLFRLIDPPTHIGPVRQLQFSPDGRHLAVLRLNGYVALWDLVELRQRLAALAPAQD